MLNDKGLQPTTVNIRVRTMRAFLRWSYLENLIDTPIHEQFKPMKTAEDTIEALTVSEIKTLLNAFDESTFVGFRDKVMVMVLLDSMVRISELLSMKRSNVDFKAGVIKLEAMNTKTRKAREVPLSSKTMKLLKEYMAGGKLTGYRKMAETVVDLIVKKLKEEDGRNFKSCQTKHLPISGGHFGGSSKFPSFIEEYLPEGLAWGFAKDQYLKLVKRYGTNIHKIFEIARKYDPSNQYGLPLEVYVELVYSLEEEMAVKPVDFIIRRTGALLFDIQWIEKCKRAVIGMMADHLGWTIEQKSNYLEELETQLYDAVNPNRPYNFENREQN